jgi:glycosyltransferase involved in cell wall biosynthesis
MKIAYVARNQLPAPSASSLHIMKMCEAFAQLGDDVLLIAAREPGTRVAEADIFAQYGVRRVFGMRRLPRYGWRGGKHLHALVAAGMARGFRADLVHGRCVWSCLAAARLGMDTSYELHTLPGPDEKRLHALLRLARQPSFRALVVTSDVLRQDVLSHYPMLSCPVVVAHNGADPRPEPDPVPLQSDVLNVGYVGRLFDGKGAEVVLALARSCPWARFHLVGATPDEIELWSGRSAGLSNIRFYEFLPHAEAMRYVDGCDVLLAPYQESVRVHGGATQSGRWMTPIKLFEYMAAGKPIIASDLPVAREVLGSGGSGFLCPPDDLQSWVDVLERLNASPSLRSTLGGNARQLFLSRYAWTARAEIIRDAVVGLKAPRTADSGAAPAHATMVGREP